MRHMTDEGLDLIKLYEGYSPSAYLCPASHWTIGYGAIWGLDNNRVTEEHPDINEEQADQLLRRDVKISEVAVLRLIKVPLEDGQFNSLCSFVFNLGSGSLQSSTLRRKINRGDYIGAADEFPRWVFAGGRKLKGLIKRRNHERLMFLD
jgi:lysozyme|tara:strand:- start:817 stop:1263 length:447 start_codon:yes stop_codon:yes gene_type:complete